MNVIVYGDAADCDHEAFSVDLSNPIEATLADSQGQGTILDDDGPGLVWQDSLNLAWDDCSFGSDFKSFNCATNTGTPFTMVASFIAPPGVTRLSGLYAELEVISATPTLPLWWQHGSAECRGSSALSVSCDFTNGPFSCTDIWEADATGVYAYDIGFGAPNRARIRVLCTSLSERSASEGTEYYAFKLNLSRSKSTGGGSCAGCSEAVTIVLRSMQLLQHEDVGSNPVLSGPISRDYVSWQGFSGTVPAGNLSVNDVTVSEDASQAIFTLSRTTGFAESVGYLTSNGSATEAGDYVASSGRVSFGGSDTAVVAVALTGDSVPEGTENFFIDLACPRGGAGPVDGHGEATIVDNSNT